MQENSNSTSNFRVLVLIVIAAILGAGVGTVAKISLREIPPIPFTLLRFVMAGLVLIPILYRQGYKLKIRSFYSLLLVSLLATGNVTFFIFGVKRTTASISQMLYAAVPLLAAILSYFILKEKISGKKMLGVLIGFIGVLIIILLPVFGKESVFNGDLIGNLITFAAVSSFSLYTVLSKRHQKDNSPLELTSYFILTTMTVQLLLLPVGGSQSSDWWNQISWGSILGIVYVGAIGTAIYYLIHQHAIKQATPTIASMILYLQPIFAIIWASILLGEKITSGFIAGGILSLVGVMLVTNVGKAEYEEKGK